jgi:hypothetical protein
MLILSKITTTCLDINKNVFFVFLMVHIKDMWICILSLQMYREKNRDAVTTGSTPEIQRICKTPIQEYKK